MIRDGAKIAYHGPETRGHAIGDEGKVLSGEPGYAHVQWTSGQRIGQVEIIQESRLSVLGVYDDDFDGPIIGLNVQATYQQRGGLGLINALNAEGHLVALPQIAEDAARFITGKLRDDPSLKEALSQLDDDDADDVLAVACLVVLKEAAGGDL